VASLAVASPSGWATTQPGWLGFIAWSGSDVLDFTHVHAESIASVRLDPAVTMPLVTGSITFVAATPLDQSGAVLGGALPCTFSDSNSAPLLLGGTGRVARLLARASGETMLSVDCLGAKAQVAIQVVGEQPSGDH
jgi:hypothetical protein